MQTNYDPKKYEKSAQEKWRAENTYRCSTQGTALYSVDTPPPTVSGKLHLGHIFSYTHADIIVRKTRMSLKNANVLYPFGFDDNGLPTERYVEKKLNVSAHKVGRSAFIKLCLEQTAHAEEQFKQLWQAVGLSVDWDFCYSTIAENVRAISQSSFIRLYRQNHIYRADQPALYCPSCRTSVAQAELDDRELPSQFHTIRLQTSGGQEVLIATTRPELLPSCVAVLYHPADSRYEHLSGQEVIIPAFAQRVPVLADDKVQMDKGTGLVMCCTFGDRTDIEWYKKFNLPYRPSINLDGKYRAELPIVGSLSIRAAREQMVAWLKEHGHLIASRDIIHHVNVHERCKNEIEYVMLAQWFLNLLDHKQLFIDLGDKIEWSPAYMKTRYRDWVAHLNMDWCLSRQRFYGIPFPAWHCTACHAVILATEDMLPVDPQETMPFTECPECGGTEIQPDTDVMDTWNTSSLTPYICALLYEKNTDRDALFANRGNFLPMSMRPQAHDIIRTWAFYTIVKSWLHSGKVPWNTIAISGHVLSSAQEKLSKSKENSPTDPSALLERYSADAIRYWTASAALGSDTPFSEEQLRLGNRLLTKLWNALRFVHLHTSDQKLQPHQTLQPQRAINQWILHTLTQTWLHYHQRFAQHEFNRALETLDTFFWHNFCDNYLECIKEVLMHPDSSEDNYVQEVRATLLHVGLAILQLYAPFLPHITETLYGLIYVEKDATLPSSIHRTLFDDLQKSYHFDEGVERAREALAVIAQMRKLKSEQKLSLKTVITRLTLVTTTPLATHEEELIKNVGSVHEIEYKETTVATEIKDRLVRHTPDEWHATICI